MRGSEHHGLTVNASVDLTHTVFDAEGHPVRGPSDQGSRLVRRSGSPTGDEV